MRRPFSLGRQVPVLARLVVGSGTRSRTSRPGTRCSMTAPTASDACRADRKPGLALPARRRCVVRRRGQTRTRSWGVQRRDDRPRVDGAPSPPRRSTRSRSRTARRSLNVQWECSGPAEGALTRLAAGEDSGLHRGDAGRQCGQGLFRQLQVAAVAGRSAFKQAVEPPVEIGVGVPHQPDLARHRPARPRPRRGTRNRRVDARRS